MPGWITDNLFWPGWASDTIGVFLGAVLGALFAYLFQRLYHSQESAAKRAELFDWLDHQLEMVPERLPPFASHDIHYLDSVDLHSIELLLDANTLTYEHDAYLVKTLDITRQNVSRYNLLVAHYNSLAAGKPLDGKVRKSLYDAAELKYAPIVLARATLPQIIQMNKLNRKESGWKRLIKSLRRPELKTPPQ